MREYGKVYTAFWTSPDTRDLSEDGRMLALYLLTCPHGNMLGCFRLSDAYAADDMQWPSERVKKGFGELFEKGFAYRCERSFYVFIRQYLKWNQFENPNVGTAAGKLFDTLGAPVMVKGALAMALKEYAPRFPSAILTKYEGLNEPFENPFDLSSKTRTKPEPQPQPEPRPETLVANAPVDSVAIVVAHDDGDRRKQPRSEVVSGAAQVDEVFYYWQLKMNHPQAKLDAKRRKAISARLKDGYTVGDLCRAVDGCRLSPHHMGQNETQTVYDDIELICRDATKVDKFIAWAKRGPAPRLLNDREKLEEANQAVVREMLARDQQGEDRDPG